MTELSGEDEVPTSPTTTYDAREPEQRPRTGARNQLQLPRDRSGVMRQRGGSPAMDLPSAP
jgi:hypothetical protein